jgi:hypothetical protein
MYMCMYVRKQVESLQAHADAFLRTMDALAKKGKVLAKKGKVSALIQGMCYDTGLVHPDPPLLPLRFGS